MAGYSLFVWTLAGFLEHYWFIQMALLALTVYLFMELSNSNALLRDIRSHMVSSTFLMLSTIPVGLFSNIKGGVVSVCFIGAIYLLFNAYQDKERVGLSFYIFSLIGLASMFSLWILLYVPLIWLLMITHLQSLGWRTWFSSILGLSTPYWLLIPFSYFLNIFGLESYVFTFNYDIFWNGDSTLSSVKIITLVFILLLTLIGIIHFQRYSMDEKIRVRQLYGFFFFISIFSFSIIGYFPQLYDPFLRVGIICSSPIIAHFFTHTHSRITNILFLLSILFCVLLMYANLDESLLEYLTAYFSTLWNGLLSY